MVDDDLSQGGAAAPDAKVARRKMTGLSNKVRPYHHGLGHSPSPHRHLHSPCCLLHGYIIRYSKSWLWTFMTRWIGGKQTPSGTRLRYLILIDVINSSNSHLSYISKCFQVRSQSTVPVPFLPVNPDYSATRNQVSLKKVTLQKRFADDCRAIKHISNLRAVKSLRG